MKTPDDELLVRVREEFVAQWGALGSHWGINRSMAQVHALLMIAPEPLGTDEVMEQLRISRGNAHANLKELVAWGLVRVVVRKGERREFFEAEKDVWKIFTIVARERKRREIEPALEVLARCVEECSGIRSTEGQALLKQLEELREFVSFASKVADRVAALRHPMAAKLAAKLFE